MTIETKEGAAKRSRFWSIDLLLKVGDELYHQRPDLQDAFPSPNCSEYWHWLMWHGPIESERVRRSLFPLPETYLRDRVVGEGIDDETFHRGGYVDWRRMERCLREARYDFGQPGALLDFGCGCARILRYFGYYTETTTLWGVDVDGEAVDWCHDHIEFANFLRVGFEPPSPFPAKRFQAVISFSVFSHLSEERHLAWLDELARITSPGAVLVLTVQGEEVARRIMAGELNDPSLPSEVLGASLETIRQRGFGFFPYRKLKHRDGRNIQAFADWDLESFGNTFILQPYVEEHWTRDFELVDYRPAPDGWQDYVVLRRR